ncbi:MAG: hypothetical protein PVG49_13570 [Desulfobacteraceae bacterium]|jgi:phage gpG-like protein
MDLTLRIAGEEKVVKVLEATSERMQDLRKPFADAGERLVRKIARRLSGAVLSERTARLKNSLTHQETADTLEISAGGGPDEVAYAAIHHYGGTIRPKKAKALTIPFPGGPADRRVPLRASDFDDTFIAKGIIFQTTGRSSRSGGERIEPLFILKKAVEIPARPYHYLEEADVEYLRRSVADYVTGEWK